MYVKKSLPPQNGEHLPPLDVPPLESRRPSISKLMANTPGNKRLLTTEELASGLGLCAQSIRKRYSQTGSYFQIRPVKLPNRRLLWPADAIEQLISG